MPRSSDMETAPCERIGKRSFKRFTLSECCFFALLLHRQILLETHLLGMGQCVHLVWFRMVHVVGTASSFLFFSFLQK